MPKVFREFADVLIHDGSSWAVNDLLADIFPGRFTKISPAAIRLNATYSLVSQQYERIVLAPYSVNENDFIPSPDDMNVAGKLFLKDRGYVNLPKLSRIDESGGYYIVRAKSNSNPVILAINPGSGKPRGWKSGDSLKDLKLVRGRDYDFAVKMKSQGGHVHKLRFVAIWNRRKKEHTYFITNLPPEKVSLADIGKLYRLRWQVELTFKELKSFTGLKKFLTGNEHIVEGFVWAALISMLLRRFIVSSAEEAHGGVRLSFHKAASSAHNFMVELVCCAFDRFHGLNSVLTDIFDYLQRTVKFSNPHKQSAFEQCVMGEPLSCAA